MKNIKKRVLSALLATGLLVTNVVSATEVVATEKNKEIKVYADWRFDSDSIKSGSIAEEDLVIMDHSGNDNDLRMQTYGNAEDYNKYISFSNETMADGDSLGNGSLIISGDSTNKIGADLITVDDAPINKENFEDGYTIEFLYKLPEDWTVANRWMGLLSRQGDSTSMDEPEVGTMTVAVSNCKEIQYYTANKDDNHAMKSAAWSVSMDKGGVWYHIAITSDNNVIRTFVNGAEAFRDYVSDEMVGMYADPNDGRFRIGTSHWSTNANPLSKFAIGNYQQIRISEGALEKSDWLVSDPELYAGDYGNNDEFTMNRPSNYNMAFLPDTQNTIKFKPHVMDKSMDWLVENKDKINLSGVVHLGDIVQDPVAMDQWNNSITFNTLPENGIKLLMQPGNHDDPNVFDEYFGVDSYYGSLTNDYVSRTSPSGRSGYMIYDGGSYKYMALSIDYYSIDQDSAWVEEVLSTTNMPTIITSHDLQNCSDTAPSAIKLSTRGQKVWNVVKKYNQVFMLIGGHSHGAGDEILINDAGNEVWSVLADYQFAYNGGNALYKFAEFDELNDKIYMSTFSPYVAGLSDEEKTFFDVNYLTGEGNYSELAINFDERFEGMEKSDEYIANVEELKALIEKAEALDAEAYTIESFEAVVNAVKNAKVALEEEYTNNEVVVEAINELKGAMDNLVEVKEEEEEEETEKPSIPTNPENPNTDGNNNGTSTGGNNNSNNSKPEKLPQTGGVNSVLPIALGVLATAGGAFVYKKRR